MSQNPPSSLRRSNELRREKSHPSNHQKKEFPNPNTSIGDLSNTIQRSTSSSQNTQYPTSVPRSNTLPQTTRRGNTFDDNYTSTNYTGKHLTSPQTINKSTRAGTRPSFIEFDIPHISYDPPPINKYPIIQETPMWKPPAREQRPPGIYGGFQLSEACNANTETQFQEKTIRHGRMVDDRVEKEDLPWMQIVKGWGGKGWEWIFIAGT